jgi:hypothetical protein
MILKTINLDNLPGDLEDEDLTFGGYPAEINHVSDIDMTTITCKEVTGTLAQLEDWLFNHYKDPYTKYYFGAGVKRSEIVRDGNKVKIACLQEDYVEFKLKINRLIHDVGKR